MSRRPRASNSGAQACGTGRPEALEGGEVPAGEGDVQAGQGAGVLEAVPGDLGGHGACHRQVQVVERAPLHPPREASTRISGHPAQRPGTIWRRRRPLRSRPSPASEPGELVGRGEVEVAMVRAEPLGDKRRRGGAEAGGLGVAAAQGEAAKEAGREGVPAAGGVDHLDLEGRHALSLTASTTRAPSPPRVATTQPTPRWTQGPATCLQVALAGQPEDLLVVGQEVVELGQHGAGRRDRDQLAVGRR